MMGWVPHAAAPVMLWGLAGLAIPILIHWFSRRRADVIDWGAMQFLDLGSRARRKFQLTEWLLLAGRMALLALVALALARPFLAPNVTGAGAVAGGDSEGEPRDVVLILNGSEGMGRLAGGQSAHDRAVRWAREFVAGLPAGSGVALLDARDRVRPLVDPLTADRAKVQGALADSPPPQGSADLLAALAESFRILEGSKRTAREVLILGDDRRRAWRSDESARWRLLKDLYEEGKRRHSIAPRLWAVSFASKAEPEGADGSVSPLKLERGLVPSGLPITLTCEVRNAGPAPLTRQAELLVDGVPLPESRQPVEPIPPGGSRPLSFRATIAAPGSHLLTVRLDPGGDPLPTNDEASRPIEVAEALPVLLVDGEPGAGFLSGEVDFLRAALAPADDSTPLVQATAVPAAALQPEDLNGQRVAVLANVDRLEPPQIAALADLLTRGGGLLVAPGDRTDAEFSNDHLFRDGQGWLPARLGEIRGDFQRRESVARPNPRSFLGPVMAPFSRGESPALGRARLFGYRLLEPATQQPAATISARLDTGDPWLIERPWGSGRVAILAGPLDAEGGTLPANADFVPWIHTLIFHLADSQGDRPPLRPGEPITIELANAPDDSIKDVKVELPDGREDRASVVRRGDQALLRFADTAIPGVYRLSLPEPNGGFAYALVASEEAKADSEPLQPDEAGKLAEGWPLIFVHDAEALSPAVLAAGGSGARPLWRWFVLAALGGLCLEVVATSRLARSRGLTGGEEA